MSILTLAQYQQAQKRTVTLRKTIAGTPVTAAYWTVWDGTGQPGAGSLSIGNTSSGIVPTDGTTGAPTIDPVSGNLYISAIDVSASAACRWMLYDRLFHAGSFAVNSSNTLTGVPSFSSRVPGGTDYSGLQIWIESAVNMNGNPLVTTTYTDQAGNTGHTTGAHAASSGNNARSLMQAPLASGDCGVMAIESTSMTGATSVGTWNVVVARPLLRGYAPAGQQRFGWMDRTRLPEIFADSCLALMVRCSASAALTIDIDVEIAAA